jgi:CrcB protein
MNYLFVAMGSAVGGVLRYWLSVELFSVTHGQFPWPTLAVNVIGSALIGMVTAMVSVSSRWGIGSELYIFLAIGVLGGFTTFSTFSLQVVHLIEAGRLIIAGAYIAASFSLCIGFAALGFWVAR